MCIRDRSATDCSQRQNLHDKVDKVDDKVVRVVINTLLILPFGLIIVFIASYSNAYCML